MNLPAIRYLQAGPMAPEASMANAAAPARAMGEFGKVFEDLGQKGFLIAEDTRKQREKEREREKEKRARAGLPEESEHGAAAPDGLGEKAGGVIATIRGQRVSSIRSEFAANATRENQEFNQRVLAAADPDALDAERDKLQREQLARVDGLVIPLAAKQQLKQDLIENGSSNAIAFERNKYVRINRDNDARRIGAVSTYAKLGNVQGVERELAEMKAQGVSDPDLQTARSAAEEIMAGDEMELEPNSMMALLEDKDSAGSYRHFPALAEEGRKRILARGRERIEELRTREFDEVEQRFVQNLAGSGDIQGKAYLTIRERNAWSRHLAGDGDPAPEIRNLAWRKADALRLARQDPAIANPAYRQRYNEARADLLENASPRHLGEIRGELARLSPEGRDPEQIGLNPRDPAELNATARRQVDRALLGGLIAPSHAEDLRIAARRFIAGGRDLGEPEVADHVSGLVANRAAIALKERMSGALFGEPGSGAALRLQLADVSPNSDTPNTSHAV
ncbi:hypothetical protein [Luteolibacter sp. Populi]|uniref:hypothetical protein n=1 Tax=Luteolibacter sp. Populi TaxID=3230487 RepID=UPI003467E59C